MMYIKTLLLISFIIPVINCSCEKSSDTILKEDIVINEVLPANRTIIADLSDGKLLLSAAVTIFPNNRY